MSSEDKNSCRFFLMRFELAYSHLLRLHFRSRLVNRFRTKHTNAVFDEESKRLNLSAQLMLDFND